MGSRIVPPHFPYIPQDPSDSQLPGSVPALAKPKNSTNKRKRADEDAETPAPGCSISKPSRPQKKQKKALSPGSDVHHSSPSDIAPTQAQTKRNAWHPSAKVYQINTTDDFSHQNGNTVHGQDPNDPFNRSQPRLHPQATNETSVYGGSQWNGQIDDPFSNNDEPSRMAQQFGDQSVPYAEFGGPQGSMGDTGGYQMYAPLAVPNPKGGFYESGAGPYSQTLRQPGIDFGPTREEFIKTAEKYADSFFRNYPWCRMRPPWGKLLALAQSEEAWNAWVAAPFGQLAS